MNRTKILYGLTIITLDFKAAKGTIVLLSRRNCKRSPLQKNKVMNSEAGTKGTVGTPQ